MEEPTKTPAQNAGQVVAPGPYPPIRVAERNREYARMLGIDFASSKSEMTSVTQYMYHDWTLHRRYPEISSEMRRIAEVEMHHLDMLGQLIILLGGDPQYRAVRHNRCMYWNGDMVCERNNPPIMIQEDIRLEQSAIETYSRQARMIRDPYVVAVIERIIEDEKLHLKLFHQMLQKLDE